MTASDSRGKDSEELDLILQVRSGRRQAFQPLVEKYWPRVHGLVRRAIKNSECVEDICQETFLRAFEKLEQFDPHRSFGPWILKIAMNKVREFYREMNRKFQEAALDDWETASSQPGPSETVIGRLLLEECLSTLPEYYRILFALRHSLMLSYEEIAEVLDEPLGSVKGNLYRARGILQERFWRMRPGMSEEGGAAG